MTISFSGLASGMDTASWVEALVSVKQNAITKLESNKATEIANKKTKEVKNKFVTEINKNNIKTGKKAEQKK